LAAMLGGLVQDGRRFVALADQQIGDMSNEMPVGTTVAVIERGMKVMSAIHKRLHYAQKTEFRLLARIFAENLPPMYPYAVAGAPSQVKAEDFDGRVDVLPVSDPNIFSMAQRVTLAQTQLQLAQSNPQMHNLHAAYRRMYQALEVQNIDEILPPMPKPQPQDPASENAAMIGGKTPQAYPQQDHDAHIEAHRAFMTSNLVKNNPATMAILQSHIMEHVGLQAREEVEEENAQAVEQTAMQYNGQLPPEVQIQIQEGMEQQISEKVAEMTLEMVTEEAEYLDEGTEDPLVDLKQQEINIKAGDLERKTMADQVKMGLDQAKLDQNAEIAEDRIQSQEDIAQLRANVNLTKSKEPKKIDEKRNIRFQN